MNCDDVQRQITAYINRSLKRDEIYPFVCHVKQCQTCRKELEINYCLLTAVRQLSSNEELTSDFIADLKSRITEDENEYHRKQKLFKRKQAVFFVEMILLGVLVGFRFFN